MYVVLFVFTSTLIAIMFEFVRCQWNIHKETLVSGESDYSQSCSAHHVKTQVRGDSPSGCSSSLTPFCLGHECLPGSIINKMVILSII